jgi:hypothetical protein
MKREDEVEKKSLRQQARDAREDGVRAFLPGSAPVELAQDGNAVSEEFEVTNVGLDVAREPRRRAQRPSARDVFRGTERSFERLFGPRHAQDGHRPEFDKR